MEIDYEGAKRLGAAIILRAISDYKINLIILKRNPENEEVSRRISRLEKFFESEVCELYSNLDNACILRGLKTIKTRMLKGERKEHE